MRSKNILNLYLINNLKLILNNMLPGDKYMPNFTKAVKINKIIEKIDNDKTLLKHIKKKNYNKKENLNKFVKILENDILELYFTSNQVLKALNKRNKIFLNNIKKENMIKKLNKIKHRKIYIK